MDLPRVLRRTRSLLEELYGPRLKGLYLFGSHARGTARADSDVDLLVVLAPSVDVHREIRAMTDALYDMELDEGVVLGLVPVSEEEYRTRQSPFLMNVRRDAVEA